MHLMCLDFKFCALNSTVEHDENTTFEDPSTDGGSNRLASLYCLFPIGSDGVPGGMRKLHCNDWL